jgi:hypothetical protein
MPRALIAPGLLLLAGLFVTNRAALPEPSHQGDLGAGLIGRSAVFSTGAIAAWHAGRRYSYRLSRDGRAWPGRYTLLGNVVCVELFDYYGGVLGAGWGGMGTCFRLASLESRLFLIDAQGRSIPLTRSPVRLNRTGSRD